MGTSTLKMTTRASIRDVARIGFEGSQRTEPTLIPLGSGPVMVKTTWSPAKQDPNGFSLMAIALMVTISLSGIRSNLSPDWIIPLSTRPAKQQPELEPVLLKISLTTRRSGLLRRRSGDLNPSVKWTARYFRTQFKEKEKKGLTYCLEQSRSRVPLDEFRLGRGGGEVFSSQAGHWNVEKILFFISGLFEEGAEPGRDFREAFPRPAHHVQLVDHLKFQNSISFLSFWRPTNNLPHPIG